MMVEGDLKKNECGRYEFRDITLTSGSVVELCIGGHRILGRVECVHQPEPPFRGTYFLFSLKEKVPVQLRGGLKARLPNYL